MVHPGQVRNHRARAYPRPNAGGERDRFNCVVSIHRTDPVNLTGRRIIAAAADGIGQEACGFQIRVQGVSQPVGMADATGVSQAHGVGDDRLGARRLRHPLGSDQAILVAPDVVPAPQRALVPLVIHVQLRSPARVDAGRTVGQTQIGGRQIHETWILRHITRARNATGVSVVPHVIVRQLRSSRRIYTDVSVADYDGVANDRRAI